MFGFGKKDKAKDQLAAEALVQPKSKGFAEEKAMERPEIALSAEPVATTGEGDSIESD